MSVHEAGCDISHSPPFVTGLPLMMTAHPLAQAPESGIDWPWLTSAAEMAVRACPGLPPRGSHGLLGESCFPRVATRTPGRDLAAVAAARRYTRSTLQRWGLASRCDDITLVVSELLTNALRHARPRPGGWPVRLGLLQPGPSPAVLCAVTDPSPAPPVPGSSGRLAETGRGLHVVSELADCWGYTPPDHRGKVVWAIFVPDALATSAEHSVGPAGRRRPISGRHRAVGGTSVTVPPRG
jgi:Histidine kinase-like ATPase domain